MTDKLHLRITGMDCADCALKLEKGLASLEGVAECRVNVAAAKMEISGDLDQTAITGRIRSLGYDIAAPDETVQAAAGLGVRAQGFVVDIADAGQVTKLADAVADALGTADILVNNAGVSQLDYTPTQDLDVAAWDRVLDVNLRGTFLCCQAFGRAMIAASGGAIVNIASTAGITGVPRAPAYCASKAGVILLTRSLALEWARHRVRVNAVAPHYLETDLTGPLRRSEKVYQGLISRIPLGRFGRPEEIAEAVLFLASPAAGYMTGSVLTADGGYLA